MPKKRYICDTLFVLDNKYINMAGCACFMAIPANGALVEVALLGNVVAQRQNLAIRSVDWPAIKFVDRALTVLFGSGIQTKRAGLFWCLRDLSLLYSNVDFFIVVLSSEWVLFAILMGHNGVFVLIQVTYGSMCVF